MDMLNVPQLLMDLLLLETTTALQFVGMGSLQGMMNSLSIMKSVMMGAVTQMIHMPLNVALVAQNIQSGITQSLEINLHLRQVEQLAQYVEMASKLLWKAVMMVIRIP